MALKGIDVSKWQGNIDWSKVNVDFAIIRAGYGWGAGQQDSKFDANIKGATANGIPVGVYWYSYATTEREAEREADRCLEAIAPYKNDIILPVFFDQEYEPGILALSNSMRTKICLTFIRKVINAGYKSGLYASFDWFTNKISADDLYIYPAWVAQYASKCNYGGANLWGWQYSCKGRVNGINCDVDLNYGYFDTKKTVDQIAQEVLDGKWGNGAERKRALEAAGYSYADVQKKVNELLTKKTNLALAKEVLQGKWGNGNERKCRLTAAGYDYNAVQKEVNKLV